MKSWLRTGLAVGATALVFSAIAVAAIPGSNGAITACYNPAPSLEPGVGFAHGALHPIDPSADEECGSGNSQITWNQQGSAGPAGATGAPGATGASGEVDFSSFTGGIPWGTPSTQSSTFGKQVAQQHAGSVKRVDLHAPPQKYDLVGPVFTALEESVELPLAGPGQSAALMSLKVPAGGWKFLAYQVVGTSSKYKNGGPWTVDCALVPGQSGATATVSYTEVKDPNSQLDPNDFEGERTVSLAETVYVKRPTQFGLYCRSSIRSIAAFASPPPACYSPVCGIEINSWLEADPLPPKP